MPDEVVDLELCPYYFCCGTGLIGGKTPFSFLGFALRSHCPLYRRSREVVRHAVEDVRWRRRAWGEALCEEEGSEGGRLGGVGRIIIS